MIMEEGNLRNFGTQLGSVIAEDISIHNIVRSFPRVLTNIDISNLFLVDVLTMRSTGKIWVHFYHEKLQNICFSFGLLRHEV